MSCVTLTDQTTYLMRDVGDVVITDCGNYVVPPPPGPNVDIPDTPANLVGTPNEDGTENLWTWDAVDDVLGYWLRWGTVDGGPYPNIVEILVADLVDPLAPEYLQTGAVPETAYYAVVSAFAEVE